MTIDTSLIRTAGSSFVGPDGKHSRKPLLTGLQRDLDSQPAR